MLRLIFLALVAVIAALHFYIAWFEIFAWTTRGPSVFDTLDPEIFPKTVQLAANQGVYNAFLGIGLIWALFIREQHWQSRVAACLLLFVIIAGITAAITISVRAGMFQILPATLALLANWLALRWARDRRTSSV